MGNGNTPLRRSSMELSRSLHIRHAFPQTTNIHGRIAQKYQVVHVYQWLTLALQASSHAEKAIRVAPDTTEWSWSEEGGRNVSRSKQTLLNSMALGVLKLVGPVVGSCYRHYGLLLQSLVSNAQKLSQFHWCLHFMGGWNSSPNVKFLVDCWISLNPWKTSVESKRYDLGLKVWRASLCNVQNWIKANRLYLSWKQVRLNLAPLYTPDELASHLYMLPRQMRALSSTTGVTERWQNTWRIDTS